MAIVRRTYNKLKPTDEAELVSLWAAGGMTAEELGAKYGLSRRGIQQALVRLGSPKKGSSTVTTVTATWPLALAEMPTISAPADRQRDAIDAAYRNAVRLESLTMQAVAEATSLGGIAALRALDLAASAMARLTSMKRAAAGLGAINPPDPATLPELTIRELTEHEVAVIRDQQLADDSAAMGSDDDDDDVVQEDADDDDSRAA